MSFPFCKCWNWSAYMKHWTLCSGLYVVGHQFAMFVFGCFRLFHKKGKVVHGRPCHNLKWSQHFPSLPAFFFLWDSCVWVESCGPWVVVLIIFMKIGYICPYSSTLGVIRFNTYSFLKDSPHIKRKKGIDYWNGWERNQHCNSGYGYVYFLFYGF